MFDPDMLYSAGLGLLAALLASSILAPFILKALVKAKSQQTIHHSLQEHAHKQGTPTMGGLIVLAGVASAAALAGFRDLAAPLVLMAVFAVLGYLDDYLIPKLKPGKRGFDWMPKMACQIGAVAGSLALAGRLDTISFGLGLFLILFYSNAYNFSDGLDSLAGGLGMILAGAFIILLGMVMGSQTLGFLLGAVIGGLMPFMFLNAPPAKVFMGDVGALSIGALFGWTTLVLLVPSPGEPIDVTLLSPLVVVSLVMFAEIVPVPLQVASAKLRKGKRLFPFKTPIHHGVQELGWSESRIAWLFHLVQAGCAVAGIILYAVMRVNA